MPPRSTNAPKSAMFLTVPLRTWPTSISSRSCFFCCSRVISISLRRLTTMLRRLSSILRIMHSIVLADVVADVARAADVDLAGGQEDVDADVDQQAALDLAGDLAGDDVALVVLGDDHLPGPHPVGLLAGEDDLAGLVLHAFEQDLDGVAGLGRRLVSPTR